MDTILAEGAICWEATEQLQSVSQQIAFRDHTWHDGMSLDTQLATRLQLCLWDANLNQLGPFFDCQKECLCRLPSPRQLSGRQLAKQDCVNEVSRSPARGCADQVHPANPPVVLGPPEVRLRDEGNRGVGLGHCPMCGGLPALLLSLRAEQREREGPALVESSEEGSAGVASCSGRAGGGVVPPTPTVVPFACRQNSRFPLPVSPVPDPFGVAVDNPAVASF